ncbi:MAG: hypothetical protein AB1480_13060 [Nitrospirota bacterium]
MVKLIVSTRMCGFFSEVMLELFHYVGIKVSQIVQGIDREEQVKIILFENYNSGKLRTFFDRSEWQPRLKKIMAWFLKRYDLRTAIKIYRALHIKPKLGWLDLFLPRLFGSIFIGFLPLVSATELWGLPLTLDWYFLGVLALFSFALTFGYFNLEYSKATGKGMNYNPLVVSLMGLGYAFVLSSILTMIFSKHFIGANNSFIPVLGSGFRLYPKILIFFAFSALLIGIFIQVFWEEKTITEPL